MKPFRLEPHSRGGCLVWAPPQEGRQYVVASDTAGGGAYGDYSVAIVIEGESCDIVAAWREHSESHIWGPKCARLAQYYNEAMLAFETQPSTHGLAAASEARNYGYGRLYLRRTQDTYTKRWTESLGFHTHASSRPLIIDRIKKARDSGSRIPWDVLLREMKQLQYGDKTSQGVPTTTTRGHDDCVIAYGIGLLVRDDCYNRQLIKTEERTPETFKERFWAAEAKRAAQPKRARPKRWIPT